MTSNLRIISEAAAVLLLSFAAAADAGSISMYFGEAPQLQHGPASYTRPEQSNLKDVNMSWETVKATIPADPEQIARAVRSHVKYAADVAPEDEWKPGTVTWEQGKGDCDDFAECVSELCDARGIKSQLYVISSKSTRGSGAVNGESHAVAVGNFNGKMWISSNGRYEEIQSLDEAREKMAREFGWAYGDVEIELVVKASESRFPALTRL